MLILLNPDHQDKTFAVRSIDPDSPIDYPNNWDEMDEIEQYAWLDNNGYGQDWTVMRVKTLFMVSQASR